MLTSERFSDDQKKRLREIDKDFLAGRQRTPEAVARRKEYIKLYPIGGGNDAYI